MLFKSDPIFFADRVDIALFPWVVGVCLCMFFFIDDASLDHGRWGFLGQEFGVFI
jgi:hypothetical protein